MENQLQQLKQNSIVVADTGDFDSIEQFSPEDATTNPSLILKAASMDQYAQIIDDTIHEAQTDDIDQICDLLSVNFGIELLKRVPGLVSTEVDARLSFSTDKTIEKAKKLIKLYESKGISKDRILIKIASTWEGIKAAEALEKLGIRCNLTLLFSFAQAQACAEANVTLISPFVGRILDWYKTNTKQKEYSPEEDPGVVSVKRIYQYYKANDYKTVVMAASFRNTGEILALSGCDKLTIAPALLEVLASSQETNTLSITTDSNVANDVSKRIELTESTFRWEHNQDPMATEKLAEGIRNFAIDQGKLETLVSSKVKSLAATV